MNLTPDSPLYQALTLIIPLILAIVFHEVAHGRMALLLGDTTARDAKRLSLNPLRHVSPMGTIVVPGLLALMSAPIFGWAKPVPVNKWRLRNPRAGMMAVAAAGPGSNLVMAALAAIVLGVFLRPYAGVEQVAGVPGFVMANLANFIAINVFLALFNLLPIPPFDGSHIVEGLLPQSAAQTYARLRPYGLPLIFLVLLVLPSLLGVDVVGHYVVPIVQWATGWYFGLASTIAGG